MLQALRAAGSRGCFNVELARIGGLRFGGRVHELRRQLYEIEVVRESQGVYRYILRHEPMQPKPLPSYAERTLAIERETLPLFAGGGRA